MTEAKSNEILKMCRSHFNEPLIVGFDVARLIGYGEDEMDCYLICQHPKYPDGETKWWSAVGGYTFLDRLKGQDYVRSTDGEDWDDLVRLDNVLSLNGAPKADEFKVVIEEPPVFVFGSNRRGAHGKGAALWALQHRGAVYGQGEGPQGNSYAIPTKDERLRTLPLNEIRKHVDRFLDYAKAHPEQRFQLTPIGCGLAGYRHEQIAPMFKNAPENVMMPNEFKPFLSPPDGGF